MTTLEDRLAALADDAPQAEASPGLWERGLRLHRRRRRGTVAIAAVVVLALGALGTASWLRSRPALPAAPPSQGMMLPDRFYDPSGRLPSTEDEGPLGRLSAVVSDANGLAGVSATTGEYRLLELPGWTRSPLVLFASDEVSLSADGLRLSYWHFDEGAVDGVAVYDTESGEVERYDIASPRGLAPDGLVWAGDVLWFHYGYLSSDDKSYSRGLTVVAWDLQTGDDRTWQISRGPELGYATGSRAGLVEIGGRRVTFWSLLDGRVASYRTDRLVEREAFLSPDGDRLAGVSDPDGGSSFTDTNRPILLLAPDGAARLGSEVIPDYRAYDVHGWRDDDHVVVREVGSQGYWSVDVRTGEAQRLVDGADLDQISVQVAQDAWAAPTYAAPEPPWPLSPWLVWGGGGAITVLGGLALVRWRRRVRP